MAEERATELRTEPRDLLSGWANNSDEWVRYIVRQVIASGGPLSVAGSTSAYALFRQEKGFDPRDLPPEEPLPVLKHDDELVEPLTLTSLSDVAGVNALSGDGTIEPHEGLTILFGENGTGKTGYSRIFKALAGSRTAVTILGNIDAPTPQTQSALIGYTLGTESDTYTWTGQHGVPPFTRMSIFDSPAVSFHVDEDLEYVYVPAVLALFNHVIDGIKAVQTQVDEAVRALGSGPLDLLSRFAPETSIYPLIESLRAEPDLEELKGKAAADPKVDDRIAEMRRTVASLEADTVGAAIKLKLREQRVLTQASAAALMTADLDFSAYNDELNTLVGLENDYRLFRTALFEAADLPADLDDTWGAFIDAGTKYQEHLAALDAHDAERCLYCRQPLGAAAQALIGKYAEYLDDKIAADIAASKSRLHVHSEPVTSIHAGDAATFAREYTNAEDKPNFHAELDRTLETLAKVVANLQSRTRIDPTVVEHASDDKQALCDALEATTRELEELEKQAADRTETLAAKKKELLELEAAAQLTKSWAAIEQFVGDAKQAEKLTLLSKTMSALLRNVTGLAKQASKQLINDSFDDLFAEERAALRTPELKVEFVGRQGRAHRRKVLTGKHKPSKVFSEGEQKVLAMADFLAEARLTGTTAPVIFDDPVTSLDHRRVNEVAKRITSLAESTQVIVFTHDILFATTLLNLMAKTKRCTYLQITDEKGKGRIARASGPRWDTMKNITATINQTIQSARAAEGDERAALIRTGYDWIRSWCEVFTEMELLNGVTQRYQPNVSMGSLENIKAAALPPAIETVSRIFLDACRYIDGHSQPLATLGVSPPLTQLEERWNELKDARKAYLDAKK